MGNVIVRVPQQSIYVVEHFGKYFKTLQPGLHFLLPFIQRVAYTHILKEQSFLINAQNAVTKDNVIIQLDGVVYLKIDDPIKCSYGAEDPLNYTYVLAQSVMRAEIGKLSLDKTFEERETLNTRILESLSTATEEWGIKCLRYEIKDIKISDNIRKVMNLQAESERQKRAEILISEGKKTSDINIAEAQKRGQILRAEAKAAQNLLLGQVLSQRISMLDSVMSTNNGSDAAKFNLADLYIKALNNLGDDKKNIVIKANLNQPDQILDKSLNILEPRRETIAINNDDKNKQT